MPVYHRDDRYDAPRRGDPGITAELGDGMTELTLERGTHPLRSEVRLLLQVAMVVFVWTVGIGILNGLDVVDFDRKVVLSHVHAGTLGWITTSVFAASLWLFGAAADPFGAFAHPNVLFTAETGSSVGVPNNGVYPGILEVCPTLNSSSCAVPGALSDAQLEWFYDHLLFFGLDGKPYTNDIFDDASSEHRSMGVLTLEEAAFPISPTEYRTRYGSTAAIPTPIASTQIDSSGCVPVRIPAAKSSESPVMKGMKTPTNKAVPAKTSPQTAR